MKNDIYDKIIAKSDLALLKNVLNILQKQDKHSLTISLLKELLTRLENV